MTRYGHVELVVSFATRKELDQVLYNRRVKDADWIPFLEQLIAQRKFK
jgi:hypothetical protein